MSAAFPPLPEKRFDAYKAAHLLWRAGFGGTWDEAQNLSKLGLRAAIELLVDFPKSKESAPPEFAALATEDESALEQRIKNLADVDREKARQLRRQHEHNGIVSL